MPKQRPTTETEFFVHGITNPDIVIRLREINSAIADIVFPEDGEGNPVYLDFDDDLVNAMETRLHLEPGGLLGELKEACSSLHVNADPLLALDQFALATEEWISSNYHLEEPPGLAILALLSLSAEAMKSEGATAANNFYRRFAERINFEGNPDDLGQVYRKYAKLLWSSLRIWLEAWDGLRGFSTVPIPESLGMEIGPSALKRGTSSNRLWAIGMATSQSRLRDADRENLMRMFEARRLHRMSDLDDDQMSLEIDRWCNMRLATSNIQKLWKDEDFSATIVQAAQHELRFWSGPRSTEGVGSSRIQLVAFFSRLKRRIEFTAELHGDPKMRQSEFAVDVDGLPVQAEMQVLGSGRFRFLRQGLIESGSLLGDNLEISSNEGTIFERRAKIVVPMKEIGPGEYVEVPQISLATKHAILFRRSVESKVRFDYFESVSELLGEHAQPGWKFLDSTQLVGLPEGWIFVDGVVILTPVSDRHRHLSLSVLKPEIRPSLSFDGGINLPGSRKRWLLGSLPDLVYSMPMAESTMIRISDSRLVSRFESIPLANAGVFALSRVDLEAGEYRLEFLDEDESKIMACTLSIVSSEHVNPGFTMAQVVQAYPVQNGRIAQPIHATTIDKPLLPKSFHGLGGLENCSSQELSMEESHVLPTSPSWKLADRSREKTNLPQEGLRLASQPSGSCITGGFHVFEYPKWCGERQKGFIDGVCKWCQIHKKGAADHFSAKTRSKKSPSLRRTTVIDISSIPPVKINEEQEQVWNTAFEAISYLRQGSRAELQRVVSQVTPEGLAFYRFANGLSNLGHIDISFDTEMQIESWTVAPAALVMTSETQGFISGFRSPTLVHQLREIVQSLDGKMWEYPNNDLPTTINISFDKLSGMQMFHDYLTEECQYSVEVEINTANRLLLALPTLGSLRRKMPKVRIPPYQNVKKWDSNTASWVEVDQPRDAGAYQFLGWGSKYGFSEEKIELDSLLTLGTPSLVKHWEALRVKAPLFYYDRLSGSLVTRLGAEIPGLYGRALIASSGRLPSESMELGVLAYHDVSEMNARLLSSKITESVKI